MSSSLDYTALSSSIDRLCKSIESSSTINNKLSSLTNDLIKAIGGLSTGGRLVIQTKDSYLSTIFDSKWLLEFKSIRQNVKQIYELLLDKLDTKLSTLRSSISHNKPINNTVANNEASRFYEDARVYFRFMINYFQDLQLNDNNQNNSDSNKFSKYLDSAITSLGTAIGGSLGAAFGGGPIGTAIGAVLGAKSAKLLDNLADKLFSFVDKFITDLPGTVVGIISKIPEILSNLGVSAVKLAGRLLLEAVKQSILLPIKLAFLPIMPLVSGIGFVLKTAGSALKGLFGLIKSGVTKVFDFVKPIISSVSNILKPIFSVVKNVWVKLVDIIGEGINKFTELFKSVTPLTSLLSIITDYTGSLIEYVKMIVNFPIESEKENMQLVNNFVRQSYSQVNTLMGRYGTTAEESFLMLKTATENIEALPYVYKDAYEIQSNINNKFRQLISSTGVSIDSAKNLAKVIEFFDDYSVLGIDFTNSSIVKSASKFYDGIDSVVDSYGRSLMTLQDSMNISIQNVNESVMSGFSDYYMLVSSSNEEYSSNLIKTAKSIASLDSTLINSNKLLSLITSSRDKTAGDFFSTELGKMVLMNTTNPLGMKNMLDRGELGEVGEGGFIGNLVQGMITSLNRYGLYKPEDVQGEYAYNLIKSIGIPDADTARNLLKGDVKSLDDLKRDTRSKWEVTKDSLAEDYYREFRKGHLFVGPETNKLRDALLSVDSQNLVSKFSEAYHKDSMAGYKYEVELAYDTNKKLMMQFFGPEFTSLVTNFMTSSISLATDIFGVIVSLSGIIGTFIKDLIDRGLGAFIRPTNDKNLLDKYNEYSYKLSTSVDASIKDSDKVATSFVQALSVFTDRASDIFESYNKNHKILNDEAIGSIGIPKDLSESLKLPWIREGSSTYRANIGEDSWLSNLFGANDKVDVSQYGTRGLELLKKMYHTDNESEIADKLTEENRKQSRENREFSSGKIAEVTRDIKENYSKNFKESSEIITSKALENSTNIISHIDNIGYSTITVSFREKTQANLEKVLQELVYYIEGEKKAASEKTTDTSEGTGGGFAVFRNPPTSGNGSFGANRGDHRHNGIDFPLDAGLPLPATENAVVDFARYGDNGRYGNLVILKGLSSGLYIGYAHLKDIMAKEGSKINKGTTIGTVGSTGRSSGPHLHFMVGIDPYFPARDFSVHRDPIKYLRDVEAGSLKSYSKYTKLPLVKDLFDIVSKRGSSSNKNYYDVLRLASISESGNRLDAVGINPGGDIGYGKYQFTTYPPTGLYVYESYVDWLGKNSRYKDLYAKLKGTSGTNPRKVGAILKYLSDNHHQLLEESQDRFAIKYYLDILGKDVNSRSNKWKSAAFSVSLNKGPDNARKILRDSGALSDPNDDSSLFKLYRHLLNNYSDNGFYDSRYYREAEELGIDLKQGRRNSGGGDVVDYSINDHVEAEPRYEESSFGGNSNINNGLSNVEGSSKYTTNNTFVNNIPFINEALINKVVRACDDIRSIRDTTYDIKYLKSIINKKDRAHEDDSLSRTYVRDLNSRLLHRNV